MKRSGQNNRGCGGRACCRNVTTHGHAQAIAPVGDKTILEHTLNNVRASAASEIVLVLGFAAEDVKKTIAMQDVKVVVNDDYQQGMGTSLRTGLRR